MTIRISDWDRLRPSFCSALFFSRAASGIGGRELDRLCRPPIASRLKLDKMSGGERGPHIRQPRGLADRFSNAKEKSRRFPLYRGLKRLDRWTCHTRESLSCCKLNGRLRWAEGGERKSQFSKMRPRTTPHTQALPRNTWKLTLMEGKLYPPPVMRMYESNYDFQVFIVSSIAMRLQMQSDPF